MATWLHRTTANLYQATQGIFFALAVILAVLRITMRLYKFHRIYADDGFLIVAMAALISSHGLTFSSLADSYSFAHTFEAELPLSPETRERTTRTATYTTTSLVLAWITIFAVKLSFLYYFRTLVQRLPRLMIWWQIVLIVCIPVAVVSICATFIVCPYLGYNMLGQSATLMP